MRLLTVRGTERRRRKRVAESRLDMASFQQSRDALARAVMRAERPAA